MERLEIKRREVSVSLLTAAESLYAVAYFDFCFHHYVFPPVSHIVEMVETMLAHELSRIILNCVSYS